MGFGLVAVAVASVSFSCGWQDESRPGGFAFPELRPGHQDAPSHLTPTPTRK
ncbi:MAG: hypothetical protein FJ029_12925 [Actinobacteria bacterium]|nr:hypothetical protein [Actinomycetota bacterium]